jgi:hypothetical protein
MTGDELIVMLQALSEEDRKLPVGVANGAYDDFEAQAAEVTDFYLMRANGESGHQRYIAVGKPTK